MNLDPSPNGELVRFEADTTDAVEFGNVESELSLPRITVLGTRVFSLSQGLTTLPRYANETALPPQSDIQDDSKFRPGAMVWVDSPDGSNSHLRVLTLDPAEPPSHGIRTWRSVVLSS